MKLKNIFFCLALISICVVASFSQDDRVVNDNAMTNELRKDGIKYEMKRAIVWAEKGSLTEQEIKEFAALANQGIVDIEKYTGIKFDKKNFQTKKIEYFLSSKAGISHGSVENKPFIYLTPKRVKNKRTAYLHETTHIIAWKSLKSLWLQEGFPSHVETYAAAHYGGYASIVFNPDNKPIDELARNLLKEEISKRVLPLVGMNGTPLIFKEEEWKLYSFIFEDRKVAAPAFYNLSESFVKFLVEKVGMKKMRKIFEAQDTRAGILKITGKNVDEWKADWLKSLT